MKLRQHTLIVILICISSGLLAFRAGAEEGQLLHLRGNVFDPLQSAPKAEAAFSEKDSSKTNLWLVQFEDKPTSETLMELKSKKIEILGYIPKNAYLVYSSKPLPEMAKVRWSGPFKSSYKMEPSLKQTLSGPTMASVSSEKVQVVVQVPQGYSGPVKRVENTITSIGGKVRAKDSVGPFVNLRTSVPMNKMIDLAADPEVVWIEPEPKRRLLGERAAQISAGDFDLSQSCANGPGYQQWLTRHGLGGAGFICHVADDGLDQGIATNESGTAHPDILGRITAIDNLTDDPSGDGLAGHGQINAGIIMGNATVGTTDSDGYFLGLGVAPEGSIYASKVFSNDGYWADGISLVELVKPARIAGALVSSNSWGAETIGGYNTDCQLYDYMTRDADPDTEGHQGMTFVFAAGNEGQKTGISLNAPASAKNVIAAGASENCDADGIDACGHPSSSADDIGELTQFTSRGPTSDNRIGVTLVAPGTHVQGPASTATEFTGSSVCGFWPQGQEHYVRSTGTSHSTPIIAGAAILFNEWYQENYGSLPSPAMVRAALINGAYDMQGGKDTRDGSIIQPIPNENQGWGRLALENVFSDSIPKFQHDQASLLTDNTPEYNVTVAASDSSIPLKITLVWTDAPSTPASAEHLRNDLDLVVEQNGTQWYGNVFANGVSITGGTPDRSDNIECAYIPTPAGTYNISVRVHQLTSDGVPGNDFLMDQDFALFVSNGNDQSPAGMVLFDKAVYSCTSTVKVSVSDTNLKGAGTISVELSSPDLNDVEALLLLEEQVDSGILVGSIDLVSGDATIGDGILQVQDSAEIMVTYNDLDNGEGQTVDVTNTAQIDCLSPVISNVKIDKVGVDSAVITWETDEKADSVVHYGTACDSLNMVASFPLSVTEHTINLTGLSSCTVYNLQVQSSDMAGNLSTSDNSGSCYKFATKRSVTYFEDSMEPDAKSGWTHYAATGTDQWQVVLTEQAQTGTHAWYGASTENILDNYLITPPFDVVEGTYLSFWHTYQLEATFDGAMIEISDNGGTTWHDLGPYLERGQYDGKISDEWGSPIGGLNAWTGGTIGAMTEVRAALGAFAGPARIVRFRLACDDSNAKEGWYVDDVLIYQTKPCLSGDGYIEWSQSLYSCTSVPVLTLSDTDLAGSGSQIISVTSTTEPGGENFTLYETSTAGVFVGNVTLAVSPAGADGVLNVFSGDEIAAQYTDAQNLSGTQEVHLVTSELDCDAPQVTNVALHSITDIGATVSWTTDEPTASLFRYGPATDQLDQQIESDFYKEVHSVTLSGLSSCTRIYYDIIVEDKAGNKTTDNNAGNYYTLRTYEQSFVFKDLFDGSAVSGWTHGAASAEDDDWSLVSFAQNHSGSKAWFTSNPSDEKDAWLITPPVDIQGDTILSFWHTFEFEEYGYDGGVLEISTTGGQTWSDLGSFATENGYNGFFPTNNPLGRRAAWVRGSLGTMQNVLVDLSAHEGQDRLIRFRFASDSSVGAVGWYIDDVEIYSYIPCVEEDTPTQTPSPTITPTPRNTPTAEQVDFNNDGVVNEADLLILIEQWHRQGQ